MLGWARRSAGCVGPSAVEGDSSGARIKATVSHPGFRDNIIFKKLFDFNFSVEKKKYCHIKQTHTF